jgi:hypothetical protein
VELKQHICPKMLKKELKKGMVNDEGEKTQKPTPYKHKNDFVCPSWATHSKAILLKNSQAISVLQVC